MGIVIKWISFKRVIVYLRINYYLSKVGIPWDKRFHCRIRMLLEDGLDSAFSDNKRRKLWKQFISFYKYFVGKTFYK